MTVDVSSCYGVRWLATVLVTQACLGIIPREIVGIAYVVTILNIILDSCVRGNDE